MNIALDYDDTYTRDPRFWDAVISLAEYIGHTVFFCTCRGEHDNNEDMKTPDGVVVYFTNGEAKKPYMARIGIKVDIWIDDMPELLVEGACLVG